MFDPNEAMLNDLQKLGVKSQNCLLVHSSYKSLGSATGGIETVIATLIAAVGQEGTLLMPALSYATVHAAQTNFNVLSTPSCVGAIPEVFRKLPNVRRSLAPTHSIAAYGKLAAEMTADHHLDHTPVGQRSPLRKLRDQNGQILMLGCGLRPNTSMHGVEELAEPPYLFLPGFITYQCTDEKGIGHTMKVRPHNFERANRQEVIQRYDRLAEVLPDTAIRKGKVLEAECWLLDAAVMWDTAEKILRRQPWFFVD